jgi:hypothetical protein
MICKFLLSGVLSITIVKGRNLNGGEENAKPLCVVEFDQHQINTKNSQGIILSSSINAIHAM